MNRFPLKFEEILKEHGIFWREDTIEVPCSCGSHSQSFTTGRYVYEDMDELRFINDYEIAGIALEEMMLNYYDFIIRRVIKWCCWYYNGNEQIAFYDENFCECIFKAVREIWG